jgi:AcrR family transcriptional regulator
MGVNHREAEAMDDQEATGLPASIEAAWGVRTRPGKGPRPALSLERIVAAAVRVAAVGGLAAVSMGRVAADLGVSTMSLYRYVGSKDELLALMADLAY